MNRVQSDRRSNSKAASTKKASGDSTDATDQLSPPAARAQEIRTHAQRETVEAFVVAFILALLFRAFVAEAFVIPTGSMAPTLMGAHKDIECERCGNPFRIGASWEQRGPVTEQVVVGGICGNCRHLNSLDLAEEPNDRTFSGDRILVSKFAYALKDPKRWDVIVFKFPGNPKQNYIKRLVGLPNETLTIKNGDVYMQPTGTQERPAILRKPGDTLMAMRHLVYDSSFQSEKLIAADYPSRMQPWQPGADSPPEDGWQISRDSAGMTATLPAGGDQPQWLRYYHRWPSPEQWNQADQGLSLGSVDPYDGHAITDFYSYNSYALVSANAVYDTKPAVFRGNALQRMLGNGYNGGVLKPSYKPDRDISQFRQLQIGSHGNAFDGMHWVGDLIFEADIETDASAKQLTLEIVEAGISHLCNIDLQNGTATLSIERDGEPMPLIDVSGQPAQSATAATSVTAGSRHRIRFSNCDDQLLLWVDDQRIDFAGAGTFDSRLFPPADESDVDYVGPHYAGPGNPLDAAPVGLAVGGGSATVHRVRLDRDKYYVATTDSSNGVFDYDLSQLRQVSEGRVGLGEMQEILASRDLWNRWPVWQTRRSVSFEMQADQYFPMGDNSPESLDARCWSGSKMYGQPGSVDEDAYKYAKAHYVPRDLLVGKALMVFWPHPWNSPVPFTPNLKRMKLIR